MRKIEILFNDAAPVRRLFRLLIGRFRLGSYRFRVAIGAVERPHYAYIVFQAAQLAARLGERRISVVEFGVAGGNGLVWLERHADEVEKLFPVEIEVYGFDNGTGLPEPQDYRDLPYHWKAGFFRMDEARLKSRLERAKLILGPARETVGRFFAEHDPAPIGAVAHDFDFYSSTVEGLNLFKGEATRLLPRVFCYFDDTLGGDVELYSEHIGQRAAIEDFNAGSEKRKIGTPFYLRALQPMGGWVNQIWILQTFDHPRYSDFISADEQQLPLLTAE
jgi:pimeloyl-ACP methyl ester carboxylesterase